jgi:hypothetical protein
LAISIALSYWLQYEKDFNAWPHNFTVAFMFSMCGFILHLLNQNRVDKYDRWYLYFIVVTAIVVHAEFGLVLALGIFFMVVSNKLLRYCFISKSTVLFEIPIIIFAIFIIHPYTYSYTLQMFNQSPFMTGGLEAMSKGIFGLFSTYDGRSNLIKDVLLDPFHILVNPVIFSGLSIGIFGFAYVTFLGSKITLILLAIIFSYLIGRKYINKLRNKNIVSIFDFIIISSIFIIVGIQFYDYHYYWSTYNFSNQYGDIANTFTTILLGATLIFAVAYSSFNSKNKNIRIFIVLFFYFLALFIVFIQFKSLGGAFRMLGIWGAFASATFLMFLASSNKRWPVVLAIILSFAHLIFGISTNYVANKTSFESYPNFYPNADGVRHFELNGVRSKYNFDYLELVDDLKLCRKVYLDTPSAFSDKRAPRFFAINLVLFLQNQRIPVYMSMPYRTAVLLGDVSHEGYKRDEVNADCVVEETMINGRISYKFIQNRSVQWPSK